MESPYLTDEACERILSGSLLDDESDLLPVRWFVEDLAFLYRPPVRLAARATHPSTGGHPAGAPHWWPAANSEDRPRQDWQT